MQPYLLGWMVAYSRRGGYSHIRSSLQRGPYPLSHHGLGDVAVVIFFGFVPVVFTEYVQAEVLRIDSVTLCTSLAIGLLAANVLIVNNYRDCDDDRAVGKHTTVVLFGRKTMRTVYLINGTIAMTCLAMATTRAPQWVPWPDGFPSKPWSCYYGKKYALRPESHSTACLNSHQYWCSSPLSIFLSCSHYGRNEKSAGLRIANFAGIQNI